MNLSEYKIIIIYSFKYLVHKSILKITMFSFLMSLVILSVILYGFWNFFPTLGWLKVIFWGFFDDMLNSFWIFIISTLFIFLYPPLSTIISGFYLDKISYKTSLLLGNDSAEDTGFMTGILSGIRILGLSSIIFFLILILKWSLISNLYVILMIQLLASGYILGKEYYEIVALRIFSYEKISLFRKKNFFTLNITGIIMSISFMVPFLNLIAPILSIILATIAVHKIDKKFYVNK